MELPIVPSFFKRIDIYQHLIDAESEIETKPIWDAEKAVLKWAAGPKHQHVGSYITARSIQDSLKDEFNRRIVIRDVVPEPLIDYIVSYPEQVMEALVMRGFAIEKAIDQDNSQYKIRINPDGFLAGKILLETNSLKDKWRYGKWIIFWWMILFLGIIILFIQALPGLKLITEFLVISVLSSVFLFL